MMAWREVPQGPVYIIDADGKQPFLAVSDTKHGLRFQCGSNEPSDVRAERMMLTQEQERCLRELLNKRAKVPSEQGLRGLGMACDKMPGETVLPLTERQVKNGGRWDGYHNHVAPCAGRLYEVR